MTTPYGIDPDEWAEAMRDAMLTGGATEAEAIAEADQARAWLTDPARANDPTYVLHNTTEDIRQWEAELSSTADTADDTDDADTF
ncbi:hypothetical protein Drose_06950 [Dactylosporangium roseum]|uniref:Uncharacterized protein n=1 Tax=Dactylosporangium roseum TaxID=47989 RepID=A0ABY5Z962_9ACTN|nr:hypothetical protein [Dactylosporangium roseum]UWZ38002.1 hypothetical protein Drose_06950 [Dactylosporangium roseum]